MLLERQQFIPIQLNEAWQFFSAPQNLAKITPEELDFKIIGEFRSSGIRKGDLIDYIVKPLFRIPMKWKTEITHVEEPFCFVDEQLEGPYKLWKHAHHFKSVDGGTMVYDRVEYELPMWPFSKLLLPIVKKKIHDIFDYRASKMNTLFNTYDTP